MNSGIMVLLVIVSVAGSALGAPPNDRPDDRLDELVAQCERCHGAGGVSAHEDVPTIAGQTAAFLEKTLRTFRDWGRPCIKSSYRTGDAPQLKTDMCQVAGGLSDEDMRALAGHFSAQPFQAAPQPFDAALAETGAALHQEYCRGCHGEDGSQAGRGPRLAGQWVTYLKTSIRFVPTGEHLVPPAMEEAVIELSPQEIDALMHYYASRQADPAAAQQAGQPAGKAE
jgi:cytochrome c553